MTTPRLDHHRHAGQGRQGWLPPLLIGLCLLIALAIVALTAIAIDRWIDARRAASTVAGSVVKPVASTGPASAVARNDEAQWIMSDDYPAESIRREDEGTVRIVWTIDTDGKVRRCRTVESSGHMLLDAAACAAIVKRGRYYPARDAQGRAMATEKSRRVTWRLPTS